jgi:peptide/nickel transport system substrate-binding protein
MYPAFGKYYNDLSGYYTQDIAKAKDLLAQAGYPNGFDLTITAPGNYQIHVDTAQVIAEQLKAIGVNCKIDTVEWSTWLKNVYQDRNYEATVVGFDTSSAMTAQSLLARFESSSGKNVCNFNSPAYDAAYTKAITSTTEAAQIAAYKDCQRILAEEAAAVYVQDPCDMVAMRENVSGYVFYPIYVMDLSRVSVS